jgi:hypothetical protein
VEGRSGLVNGSFDFGIDRTNPLDSGNHFANQLLGNFRTYTEVNTRETYQIPRCSDGCVETRGRQVRSHCLWSSILRRPVFQNNRRAHFRSSKYNRPTHRANTSHRCKRVRVGFDPVTGQSYHLVISACAWDRKHLNGIVSQTDAGNAQDFEQTALWSCLVSVCIRPVRKWKDCDPRGRAFSPNGGRRVSAWRNHESAVHSLPTINQYLIDQRREYLSCECVTVMT